MSESRFFTPELQPLHDHARRPARFVVCRVVTVRVRRGMAGSARFVDAVGTGLLADGPRAHPSLPLQRARATPA